jgi:ankyrin repeat protein
VTTTGRPDAGRNDDALLSLFRSIAAQDDLDVASRLEASPDLASRPIRVGASRQDAPKYFLNAIGHYVYAGDTALHVTAAAHRRPLAEALVTRGADVRARNRRGQEPLHYAAAGRPGEEFGGPGSHHDVIAFLVGAGADPNALDKSGVAPLHRAVRDRCSASVAALVAAGADPLLMNRSGSTPLHLAVQNTGKSGSGSDAAKDEQGRVIALLLEHGASPADVDAKGKTVADAATSAWVRELLGLP